MSGHFLNHQPSQAYPPYPQFSGFMKPCRFEGQVQDLEVEGVIPPEIDGTFYRVMPDPQFPPFVESDPWFNGDGNVSAFQIQTGRAHFMQRYVRTEKFVRERKAHRALGGKYRNKYTDAVAFRVRTTANTNIFYFNGKLLAIKEDAPPYAMDPRTLETIGLHDFDGQLQSTTFTAHPKIDPDTGEMICFGYEARGDGTPDICYSCISPQGVFTETVWLVSPIVAMIHDFAVTKNWIIFPIIPQTCDIERMKQGGEHWQWNPDVPFYIGVLPRRGAKGSDVKWFRSPNAFPGHTSNAYEDSSGKIIFDLPVSKQNVFFWWPDAQGQSPNPHTIEAVMTRFTIDPHSDNLDLPEPDVIDSDNSEFPRIDDRYSMKAYSHTFFLVMLPSLGTDMAFIGPLMGGGFPPYNGVSHLNLKTREREIYCPGRTHLLQEPVFFPRTENAGEGDGYLMLLVNNYSTMSSELHIIDTRNFTKAVAIVHIPLRLRHGLHGNWVSGQELDLIQ